jgi:hypothetical protein
MVNICLFANVLLKITFLTRKWNIYMVILSFMHLSQHTIRQWMSYHTILGFANRTVTQLPRLMQHFGMCDHQGAFSESQRDGSHLVRGHSGCMTLPSTLLYQGCLCWAVGGLGTKCLFMLLDLWKSVLVITAAKVMLKRRNVAHSHTIFKA